MATNDAAVTDALTSWEQVADLWKQYFARAEQAFHNDLASGVDWNTIATDNPDLLDADGVFIGKKFTPADVENAKAAQQAIMNLTTGQGGSTGFYSASFERLSRPII